jgi:hypothetical protein
MKRDIQHKLAAELCQEVRMNKREMVCERRESDGKF